ncbi:MAG: VOC family protein [Planctomycetota bacterium]|nr:VOC family protein [Planctomycetota bacterium]
MRPTPRWRATCSAGRNQGDASSEEAPSPLPGRFAVSNPKPVLVENSIPILRVKDLKASVAYYLERLGFKVDWEVPGEMASVSRDRGAVMLCQGAQGHPGTWVWVGVEDAGRLHEEFAARGAKILFAPRNYAWAREFHVEDPDGHVLRFGSESLSDRPLDPWLHVPSV